MVVGGVLLEGDCAGNLNAYDVTNPRRKPRRLWRLKLDGCIESTPAVGGAHLPRHPPAAACTQSAPNSASFGAWRRSASSTSCARGGRCDRRQGRAARRAGRRCRSGPRRCSASPGPCSEASSPGWCSGSRRGCWPRWGGAVVLLILYRKLVQERGITGPEARRPPTRGWWLPKVRSRASARRWTSSSASATR